MAIQRRFQVNAMNSSGPMWMFSIKFEWKDLNFNNRFRVELLCFFSIDFECKCYEFSIDFEWKRFRHDFYIL